jgi:hypothetical protein
MLFDLKVLRKTLALLIIVSAMACNPPEEEGEDGPPSTGGGSISLNCPSTIIDPLANYMFEATGGAGDYLYSKVSGGGTLNAATGAYKAAGSGGSVTVSVKDAANATKTCTFTVYTPVAISPSSITINAGFSTTFTYSNGIAPFTFSVVSGGGSINSAGVYTAPLSAGTATVKVTDGKSNTSNSTVTINLSPPGSFAITGLTGGTDTVADLWLSNGVPTVNWSAATAATSYTV